MIGSRRIGRTIVAVLGAAVIGCGTVVAGAGIAEAAGPNEWGFALVENPVGPVTAGHWQEIVASPAPTASPHLLPGEEVVKFPRIGFAKNGVVAVTAITDQLAWCQAQSWGPSAGAEFVTTRCNRRGGVPVFVPFTIMFAARSGTLPGGLQYAYVVRSPLGAISSYNSKAMADTVITTGTGAWEVTLHGPGPATASGGVQVTAVSPNPRICDIAGSQATPSEQIIQVRCYNAAGVPTPSGWTLTYQRGRAITGARPARFAYTVNNQPLVSLYTPAPAGVNFNSLAAVNTVHNSAARDIVTMPRVGTLPNTVLVTAQTAGVIARVCNLNELWVTAAAVTVRDVVCYTTSGAMTPAESFTTYTS